MLALVPSARAGADAAVLENDRVRVEVDPGTGRFQILFEGRIVFRQAAAAIRRGPAAGAILVAADDGAARGLALETMPGGGQALTVTHPATDLRGPLVQVFTLEAAGGGLQIDLRYEPCPLDTQFISLLPVYVGSLAPGSGLFVGDHPSTHRVLQNGSDLSMDMLVRILPGGTPLDDDPEIGDPSPYSNWSSLIHDPASGRSLLSGHLTFDRMACGVYTNPKAAVAPLPDGRAGISDYAAHSSFIERRDVTAWGSLAAETLFLNAADGPAFDVLEDYADRVASRQQIQLPATVPSGWDSWYWYYESVDQEKVLANLQALTERFLPYGLTKMQIDLGWYARWGDWEGDPARFPEGMAWLADRIREAGLKPELWIAPFVAFTGSDLLAAHPDWVAALYGWVPPFPDYWKVLNISRPDVLSFLEETGARVRDWGYESVKFDFAQASMLIQDTVNPSETNIQVYRRAVERFRTGFGPEKPFTNILIVGANIGLVDVMRIGLDSWPCWGDEPGEACPYIGTTTGPYAQGIRPSVRMVARRYYFHDRVWHVHPDQVFFRDFLPLEPQRAWAAVVGLSGGVVSLGDEATTLSPEGGDVFRRLLPVFGRAARPLDLMEREYPEVWHLDLSDQEPEGHLFGLFNWGTNLDLTRSPFAPIPEEERTLFVDLDALGLAGTYRGWEYWTGTDFGIISGNLSLAVPPRDCRLVVLRPLENHPQILSSNRHITQGATDLSGVSWKPLARTLVWTQDLVPGFPHRVTLTRSGFPYVHVRTLDGTVTATVTRQEDVFQVDLRAERPGPVALQAVFGDCLDADGDGFGTAGSLPCPFPEPDCDDDPADDPDGCDVCRCGTEACAGCARCVHPFAREFFGDAHDSNCNGDQDCFVATAAFGTGLAGKLEPLRAFRDRVLLRSPAGRALVNAYYGAGPELAEALEGREWLRAGVRFAVLPWVGLLWLLA